MVAWLKPYQMSCQFLLLSYQHEVTHNQKQYYLPVCVAEKAKDNSGFACIMLWGTH